MLQLRYGAEPYQYKIKLQFPSSHPEGASTGELLIELAPAKFMPHAVYLVRRIAFFPVAVVLEGALEVHSGYRPGESRD
jgi:hypothetical protein